jgi:hypothetical protein
VGIYFPQFAAANHRIFVAAIYIVAVCLRLRKLAESETPLVFLLFVTSKSAYIKILRPDPLGSVGDKKI